MGDPYKRDRRLGRWHVTHHAMLDYRGDILERIQRDVTVLRAQESWRLDAMEFTGRSEHFEIVPEGDEIPLYRHAIAEDKVKWERA